MFWSRVRVQKKRITCLQFQMNQMHSRVFFITYKYGVYFKPNKPKTSHSFQMLLHPLVEGRRTPRSILFIGSVSVSVCLDADDNQRARAVDIAVYNTHMRPSVCRPPGAVLQSDVVPQSGARTLLHSSDRLGQWPLHSAMGQEEAVHPGSLHWDADRSGTVSQWIADRWVFIIWCL